MQHFGFMGRAAVTAALLIGSAGLATAGSPHDTQGHYQSDAPGMKLGDLIRIRSGGPLMTVNAINGDQVVTIWATEDGRMSSGTFNVTNLTKLGEPPVQY
jgi:uncharacterized protein YodC (DUF2158 family)